MLAEAMRRRDDEQTDGPDDVEDGEQDNDDSQVDNEILFFFIYIKILIFLFK